MPQHHPGNLLTPDIFFGDLMMCQGNFQHQKGSNSTSLTASCSLSPSQPSPALSFSITAGRAAFPISLTPRAWRFTGRVIALLRQKRNGTLWPPRALIIQHYTDCSTPKTFLCKEESRRTRDAQPLKSWLLKQQHGRGADHPRTSVKRGLCGAKALVCSNAHLSSISISASMIQRYRLSPAKHKPA